MSLHHQLMKACQDDARRVGERDRLLLEARRALRARRQGPAPVAPARRLARLLARRAAAAPRRFPASPGQTGQGQLPAPHLVGEFAVNHAR
jgi:hypothetical protein